VSKACPERLIERHQAFLECGPADRPLLGHWVGGYYPAEQFPRGTSRWAGRRELHPEDVQFPAFADDYESLYQAHRACDDDFFYVGSAYWGIPWLEAILGCPVSVAAANCRAEPCLGRPDDLPGLAADPPCNPWLAALVRFTEELVEFAGGRFPVCPPLLRGPGDAASALLGGTALVTGLLDDPAATGRLLAACRRVRDEVLDRLGRLIPPWHGTHAAGGYPSKLWCRDSVAYYQEDCAALLSPRLFREHLLPLARQSCQAAEVNFIHLHSACLYPVDILLDGPFDVLEINIDHRGAGPAVAALVPVFRRIQAARRPLLLWGQCPADDWDLLRRELSPVGLSLQPAVSTPEEIRHG
jgi:hypothetical protein